MKKANDNAARFPLALVVLDKFGRDINGNPIARHTVEGYRDAAGLQAGAAYVLHTTGRRLQVGYGNDRDANAPDVLRRAGLVGYIPAAQGYRTGDRSAGRMVLAFTAPPPRPAAFRVIVGNLGEVYAGDSQREARAAFREYVADSLAGYGRAAGEPVALVDSTGEALQEFAPVAWSVEVTDTFAGEANYSWVRRATVYADPGAGRVAIIRKAKKAADLGAVRCRVADLGDGYRLDVVGACVVCFINPEDQQ